MSQKATPEKEQRGTEGERLENWSIIVKQQAREIGGRKESE